MNIQKGMMVYKHKGFVYYIVSSISKSKNYIELHKMNKSSPEEPIKLDDFLKDLEAKRYKVLSEKEGANKFRDMKINTDKQKNKAIKHFENKLLQIDHLEKLFGTYCYNATHPEETHPQEKQKIQTKKS